MVSLGSLGSWEYVMKEVKELLTRIAVAVERIAEAILVERQADPMEDYRRRVQDQAARVTGR